MRQMQQSQSLMRLQGMMQECSTRLLRSCRRHRIGCIWVKVLVGIRLTVKCLKKLILLGSSWDTLVHSQIDTWPEILLCWPVKRSMRNRRVIVQASGRIGCWSCLASWVWLAICRCQFILRSCVRMTIRSSPITPLCFSLPVSLSCQNAICRHGCMSLARELLALVAVGSSFRAKKSSNYIWKILAAVHQKAGPRHTPSSPCGKLECTFVP